MAHNRIAELARELHELALVKDTRQHHLSNREIELLACLSEELGELQQVIGKILRWGWESSNPLKDTAVTNCDRFEAELGDVFAVLQLMRTQEYYDQDAVLGYQQKKLDIIRNWLQYQQP